MTEIFHNKQVLREAYRQWHDTRGGSTDAWMAFIDPDISFGSLAEGAEPMAFTAPLQGRDKLAAYFDGLLSQWEMEHYTVDEMVAEGERVVVIGSTSWRNKQTGKCFESRKVDVWRFRDGKAVEFYEYYDTAKVVAAC